MIGTSSPSVRRVRLQTSMPSMPGIMMSSTISFGRWVATKLKALFAVGGSQDGEAVGFENVAIQPA